MVLPILYQRLEALAVLVGSVWLYFHWHFNVWLWLLLLLAFDVSMLGYLVNPRWGAHLYNLGHSFIGPVLLLVVGAATGNRAATGLALIWLAHIGLDRTLGYGLKHPDSFQHTHLGVIGRKSER